MTGVPDLPAPPAAQLVTYGATSAVPISAIEDQAFNRFGPEYMQQTEGGRLAMGATTGAPIRAPAFRRRTQLTFSRLKAACAVQPTR
jgi:hypothetical protein